MTEPGLPDNQNARTFHNLNDTELESGRTELHLMTSQQRADARQWASDFTSLTNSWLSQWLGDSSSQFIESARAVTHADGRVSIVWMLSLTATIAIRILSNAVDILSSKIRQLLELPQHSNAAPAGTELAQRTHELLTRLSAEPNVKMGLFHNYVPNNSTLALWLKFELPAPAESPERHPVL